MAPGPGTQEEPRVKTGGMLAKARELPAAGERLGRSFPGAVAGCGPWQHLDLRPLRPELGDNRRPLFQPLNLGCLWGVPAAPAK